MLKADVIGHIGQDATVNNVNGKVVINFSVCHTEKYKDKNGVDTSKSTWLSCSYWSDRTAIVQYLKKGTQVYVCGQPDAKTYSGKNGEAIPQLTLRVQSIQLLGSTQNRNEGNAALQPQQQESFNASSDDDSGLPF